VREAGPQGFDKLSPNGFSPQLRQAQPERFFRRASTGFARTVFPPGFDRLGSKGGLARRHLRSHWLSFNGGLAH